jgi:hypothetical protein
MSTLAIRTPESHAVGRRNSIVTPPCRSSGREISGWHEIADEIDSDDIDWSAMLTSAGDDYMRLIALVCAMMYLQNHLTPDEWLHPIHFD